MKCIMMGLALLCMTSCTKSHRQTPDLGTYSVTLTHTISISFLDKESGLILLGKTDANTPIDRASAVWKGKKVYSGLSRRWDGDTLVIQSNINEYRIPYASISHFSRNDWRSDVDMEYDKEANRWNIKEAEQLNAELSPAAVAPDEA